MGIPGGSVVKNTPVMQETWAQHVSLEAPLEEGTVTHSSILAWRIPRTEGPGGRQSIWLQRTGHDGSDYWGIYRKYSEWNEKITYQNWKEIFILN